MTHEEFIQSLENIYKESVTIAKAKNKDYSVDSDPFKNFRFAPFVGVTVERGILVRLCDKISRVSNLLEKEASVKDEGIEDTLKDLINYSAILLTDLKSQKAKTHDI